MEQLIKDMNTEIKELFDKYLEDEDESRCNYLIFDDLDDFKDFYDEFVEESFNSDNEQFSVDWFSSSYDFSWFDAFKVIKLFMDDVGCTFNDYDDQDKSWTMFCYACARMSDICELDEYTIWYKSRKQNFTHKCHKQLEFYEDQLTSYHREGPQKVEYNAYVKFYKSLIDFDIDKATQNLTIINLVFQRYMRKYEKEENEKEYILICHNYMTLYNNHLYFKEQAIKIMGS